MIVNNSKLHTPTHVMIVESVKKAKTISTMFPYIQVISCKGHIEDVISYDDKFNLKFEWNNNALNIKKILKTFESITCLIAVDMDREGEQIAHSILKLIQTLPNKIESQRIIFPEITKKAIQYAIDNPVILNENMVLAQNARVIIDRIIGFDISRLIHTYLGYKNGCGRIQTLVLFLIEKQFKEIQEFIAKKYYTLKAKYKDFILNYSKNLDNITELDKIKSDLYDNKLYFHNIKSSNIKGQSKQLLNTIDIYKNAFQLFGYSTKKTSLLMQNLYEGVEINKKNVGLISYPRSDSRRINYEYQIQIQDRLAKYNLEYLFDNKHINIQKQLHIQDAHECVHPTDLSITPDSIKNILSNDLFKLYNMIYNLTFAAFCKPYEYIKHKKYFSDINKKYLFFHEYFELKEEGYIKFLPYLAKIKKDTIKESDIIIELISQENLTTPPALYKEHQIIDLLFKQGIGRPASYASIIPKLIEKNQIEEYDNDLFITKMGLVINKHMQLYFNSLFNLSFTSQLEKQFNEIVQDKSKYYETIYNCKYQIDQINIQYKSFIQKAIKNVEINCLYCNNKTPVLTGKYGSYINCSANTNHKASIIFDGNEVYINKSFPNYYTLNYCENCSNFLCIKKNKIFCHTCDKSTKYIKYNTHNKYVMKQLKSYYFIPLFDIANHITNNNE